MSNILKRTPPHVYLQSVNTPDYLDDLEAGTSTTWIINPDLTAVEGVPQKYWVIEIDDTVREMTVEEKAAYDAANPPPVDSTKLSDGRPAYLSEGIVRSVNENTFIFSTATTGTKNTYLNTVNDVSSNLSGYVLPHKSVITRLIVQIEVPVSVDVAFELRYDNHEQIYTTLTIEAGQTYATVSPSIIVLPLNSELSMFVRSTELVKNPSARVYIAETD